MRLKNESFSFTFLAWLDCQVRFLLATVNATIIIKTNRTIPISWTGNSGIVGEGVVSGFGGVDEVELSDGVGLSDGFEVEKVVGVDVGARTVEA